MKLNLSALKFRSISETVIRGNAAIGLLTALEYLEPDSPLYKALKTRASCRFKGLSESLQNKLLIGTSLESLNSREKREIYALKFISRRKEKNIPDLNCLRARMEFRASRTINSSVEFPAKRREAKLRYFQGK